MLYESWEAVFKLFNNYSSTVSEAKYTTIHGKGIPSMSACVACNHLAHVAKFFNHKVSNHSNLKMLSPKQMLQRLPIALAQVKAGNTSENLLNEIRQIIYSLYWEKEITKKVFNNIVEFKKYEYIINSIKL